MSLTDPTFLDAIRPYKTWLIYGALAIVLIGIALGLYSCGDEYLFKSKLQKDKDAIKTETNQIANITSEIHELEKTKAAAQANVNAATAQLEKDIFGREELKKETNQALANFQKAVNANANIDRTAEDLKRVLDKLDDQ
jgi:small-conductance mechanosensitive channel